MKTYEISHIHTYYSFNHGARFSYAFSSRVFSPDQEWSDVMRSRLTMRCSVGLVYACDAVRCAFLFFVRLAKLAMRCDAFGAIDICGLYVHYVGVCVCVF